MNPTPKVMLLVDADNVSVGVIEQAVQRLLAEHGALHVRRAYCTAESARKNQALFKRLGMRPMVNLAAGKNSTDIALAVDALDLVLAERPAVVVIASSDSDFAPLVSRLREKGCRVCGIGQEGKTGSETLAVYDEFVELPAKAVRATRKTAPAAARSATTRRAGGAAGTTPPAGGSAGGEAAAETSASPATADAGAPALAAPARKTPRKTAAKTATGTTTRAARTGGAETPKAAARRAPRRAAAAPEAVTHPAPAHRAHAAPPAVQQLLQALPALARGEQLELQKAAEVLRRAGQLSRRSSAQKLFARYPQWFELNPEREPRQVALRAAPAR